MLKELGIVIGTDTKAGNIFEEEFSDFMELTYSKPSEFVSILWER